MRRPNLLALRRKKQSSRAVMERQAWWRRIFIGGVVLILGVASYQLAPKIMAGWTSIQHVSISGAKLMKRGDIIALLALPTESSLWTIDTTMLQQQLEAHPRIASASVGRALPHTLVVVVDERVPAANFQHAGGQLVVDQDGVVLSVAPEDVTLGLPTFSGLSAIRLLEGDAATRDQARLGVEVSRLLRERSHSQVHIRFRDPNEIVVVADDVTYWVNQHFREAWQQYLLLEPTILAGLSMRPYEIDLRYSDKVIVRQRG